MSKRMKKLIGALLSLTMILSSVGFVALADEGTASTDPAAEQADAAETPEPTEAPSAYDNDKYYDRALVLLSSLGIIEGYEDGSVKPDSTITRAEMAAVVLRMLNVTTLNPYANAFNDVTSDHWAADTIQTAAEQGIINGMGDGSFNPDGNVTYEQVVKMIVCALGYDIEAQLIGPYPSGYIAQASVLDLDDEISGTIGAPADRGLVMKMVYNALLTFYNEPSGISPVGKTTYSAWETLAKAKFKIVDAKGTLTATANKSLDPSLENLMAGRIAIDGTIYESEVTGIDDLVGTSIIYFYRETTGMASPVVLAVASDDTKTEKREIDIDNVDGIYGFETGEGIIDMHRGSDIKCKDAIISYNGKIITAADYANALALSSVKNSGRFNKRDYDGTDLGTLKTFDELLLPDVGSLVVTDSNGDGTYDYVTVESYETMTVTSVSTKNVTGDVYGETRTINVDLDSDPDLTVRVIRNGDEVRARNLAANDVASVMQSLDGKTVSFVVTGDSVEGKVSSAGIIDNEYVAKIDGKDYVVDANAMGDVKSGTEGIFYLDTFGRIGYVSALGSGKLSGSEKYGWIMSAYESESGSDTMIKMFTQDGEVKEFTLASNVSYWGPTATEARTLSGAAQSEILSVISSNEFIAVAGSGYPIRLCKYRANASNQLNKLYLAVGSETVDPDDYPNDALLIDTTNLNGRVATGITVDSHVISDGIVGFQVPRTGEDMNSASEYSVFSVTASNFVNTATGPTIDYVVGEFTNTRNANVLIRYETSTTAAASVKDYSNTADNPVAVVTSVDDAVDEDGDPLYVINARRSGSEVQYTTTKNTILVKSQEAGFGTGNGNTANYLYDELWNAVDNKDSIADYLNEGDIIGVQSNSAGASIIIKFVDIKELANKVATGTGAQTISYYAASETRDGYGLGAIADVDTPGDTYFNLRDNTNAALQTRSEWYLSSSAAIDLVDVETDENGYVDADVSKNVYEPSEIMNFNFNTLTGDYLFFRTFRNGAQREAYIIRFNDR